MADEPKKVRGVVDLVFLIDATGSMQHCIDALKENLNIFMDSLTGVNSPVNDWRAKVVGYRDFDRNQPQPDEVPFVDNPFVRSLPVLKSQLGLLRAFGGGDEPESLLDAIHVIATMGSTRPTEPEDPSKWRDRRSAARVVLIFTDASYKEKMFRPGFEEGGFEDMETAVLGNKIILSIFAPDLPCYDKLGELDRSVLTAFDPVGTDEERKWQSGLAKCTADQRAFCKTLEQLAKSIEKSTTVEVI